MALKDSPYEINPLAIKNLLRTMHDEITAGWEDQDTIDEYEKASHGEGDQLLKLLKKGVTDAMADAAASRDQ